jgi:hypothetical protein
VLLVHQQTGAVRDAPWIALRTRDGCIYFANLLTRETRWLPPHLWMHGWVSRTKISDSRSSGSTMSQILDNGRDLPCDGRKPLPPLIAFKRVEGGAPYMYESTHGAPQYPPDESGWDSQLTYPLEGSYTPMPVPCVPSSLPLSSPSSPSPPSRPPPSPTRLPPGYEWRLPPGYDTRLLTHEEMDEWEEMEYQRRISIA